MQSKIRLVKTSPVLLALWALGPACGMRTAMHQPSHRDAAADVQRTDLPDLRPDAGPDLGPPFSPEVSPDRSLDTARDLPHERLPDVVSPIDRSPDRARDLPPVFDARRDLPRRVLRDSAPDLPPRLDGPCAEGATLPCTCANGLAGSRICLPSRAWSECGCGTPELMRVRNGVIGTWIGTVATPWLPPYTVTFTFDSYTHYSARSLDGDNPALYYGTDEDSPEKRYDITDIQDNGDATGYLDIVFGPGNYTRQSLAGIQLSADGDTLRFWFMEGGDAGPLQYELRRALP